jgi:hypothetical protein
VILYTVMPEEFVLAGLGHGVGDAVWWLGEKDGGGSLEGGVESAGRSVEKTVGGASGPIRLVLERNPGGGWRVSRLLSSDPYDYLNPAFAPGQLSDGPWT